MPYKIISKIASGTFGTVFKVQKSTNSEFYALKLIHENYKNPKELKRIKRGFESAQKVSSPNCVKMIEWYEKGNDIGFVMEFVETQEEDLTGFQKPVRSGKLTDKISKIIQIANGLEALHSRGIVHRDLKPENVLVNKEGKIKITDFDLIKLEDASTFTKTGAFVGTLKYSSPEQCRDSGKIDFRTDLYSLGVIFYEMVTGQSPIKGETLAQVALAHVRTPILSPQKHVRDLPVEIEKIILRLLEKDPENRFQSAGELAKILNEILIKGDLGKKKRKRKIENNLLPPVFVSRQKELQILEKAFSETANGNFQSVFVSGESGIGKSKLIEEFRLGIVLQNAKIFDIRCKIESLAFEPLQSLITNGLEAISTVSDKEKAEIVGRLGWDFEKIFPEIGKMRFMEKIGKLPLVEGKEGEIRLFEAVTNFLKKLSEFVNPLVLIFEDLQWLDEPTSNYLKYAFRNLKEKPIMFVGNFRSNEISKTFFEKSYTEIRKRFSVKTIELLPLNLEETIEILTSILGKQDPVETEFAKFILEKSNGNPLYMREIIQNLFVKKKLQNKSGSWNLETKHLVDVKISENIHSVIMERLFLLDKTVVSLLEKGAILGKNFELEMFLKLTKMKPENVKLKLEFACKENLLEKKSEAEFSFVHDSVREALEKNLDSQTHQKLHRIIGENLEQDYSEDKIQIVERLANHFYFGKVTEKAYKFLILAFQNLSKADAKYQALAMLNKANELVKDSNDIKKLKEITEYKSLIYYQIGDFEKCKEFNDKLIEYSTNPNDYEYLGIANLRLGRIAFIKRDLDKALVKLQEALKNYKKVNLEHGISSTLVQTARIFSRKGDFEKAFENYDFALEIAQKNNLLDEISSIYGAKGTTYGEQRNYKEAINCFNKQIESAKELKITRFQAFGYNNLSTAYYLNKEYSKALKAIENFMQICKTRDYGLGLAHYKTGQIYFALGKFEKALESYLKSLEIYEEVDFLVEIPYVSENIGKLYLENEDYEKSLEFFKLQLETTQELKNENFISKSFENISDVHFLKMDFKKSNQNLNAALKISKKLKAKNLIASQNLKKAKILVEEKDFVKAQKLIEQSKEEFPFETKLLTAKINSLTNKTHLAILDLEKMLFEYKNDEEQAEILFKLTFLKNSNSLKSKTKKLYKKLIKSMPKALYKNRFAELEKLNIVESNLNLELIEKLTKWMTPETLFEEFLDYLQKETNSFGSQIILKNEISGKFETTAVSSNLENEDTEFSETILEEAIKNTKPTLIENAVENEEYKSQKSILGKFFLSVIAVPLFVKDKIIGAIYLERRDFEKGSFTDYELSKVVEISKVLSPTLKRQNQALRQKIHSEIKKLGIFVGNSPKMQEVYNKIEDASKVNFPVYIHGETGTGKELVSNALHKLSLRRTKPFVAVNCSAIPKDLAESELFGHTKGAFSGAVSTKKGKFELANEGTLFLDEVAELSLDIQAKLLRVLQNQTVWKVGSEKPIKINTRVIVATHKDLKEEVKRGNFREDLMFRLDVLKIEMPPLRERPEDISLLAKHFLKKHSEQIGKEIVGYQAKAITALEQNTWTGNVRELENTILKVIVNKKDTNPISYEDLLQFLQEKLKEERSSTKSEKTESETFEGETYAQMLDNFERKVLLQALESNNWNKTTTAKSLKLTRNKLYKLLTKHNLLK